MPALPEVETVRLTLLPAIGARIEGVWDSGKGLHMTRKPPRAKLRKLAGARIHLGKGDVRLAAKQESPDALVGKVVQALLPSPPVRATHLLEGPSDIPVPGGVVKAFPMPGHTKGSYAYLYDGVLFVGDTMSVRDGALGPPASAFDAHPGKNREAVLSLKQQLGDLPVDRLRLLGDIGLAADPGRVDPLAAERFRESLTIADDLGMRPLVAHCHLGLGKLYRRTGQPDQAQEHLTAATTMYREMDMQFWLEKGEAEMGELA